MFRSIRWLFKSLSKLTTKAVLSGEARITGISCNAAVISKQRGVKLRKKAKSAVIACKNESCILCGNNEKVAIIIENS